MITTVLGKTVTRTESRDVKDRTIRQGKVEGKECRKTGVGWLSVYSAGNKEKVHPENAASSPPSEGRINTRREEVVGAKSGSRRNVLGKDDEDGVMSLMAVS